MERFNDERESARPGEAERESYGVAEGGVAVGDAEGVGAQHGGDGVAVGAGGLRGDAGLVVLQADAEEGLAVALLQPRHRAAPGAAAGQGGAQTPSAAVAVPQQALLVHELLQLQLEHPGAPDLAGAEEQHPQGDQQSQRGLTSHLEGVAGGRCWGCFFFTREAPTQVVPVKKGKISALPPWLSSLSWPIRPWGGCCRGREKVLLPRPSQLFALPFRPTFFFLGLESKAT